MPKLLILAACFPMLLQAQEEVKGIRFVKWLSWEQVQAKAKDENKYVFVDAFATWCGPCKMMDRDIYSNDTVASLINDKFIAVKVQMDSSARDNEDVKSWYSTSREISNKYSVQGYPSFLFFSPDGKLVYKDLGYKDVQAFTKLLVKALDPQSLLYYGELEGYKKGKKNYAVMGGLAQFVEKVILDKELADSIAKEYKENYLDKLSKEVLFTKENLDFIGEFYELMSSKDNFFLLCYSEPERADILKQTPGWAKNMVKNTLTLELERKLYKDNKALFKNPNWSRIRSVMQNKYVKLDAKKLVLDYQIFYYRWRSNDWEIWSIYKDERIKEYPPKPGTLDIYRELNVNGAWDAFKYCNNKKVLNKTLRWIDMAISFDEKSLEDQYLDTKAALLYKLGRVGEAIACEEKAIETGNNYYRNQGKSKGEFSDQYKEVIEKMKKGEPTYLEEGAVWNAKELKKNNSLN